jgi:hypothetical protein
MTDEKPIEKFTIEICVGDEIEIGRYHLANQTITAIELDKWGHPVVTTNRGRRVSILAKRLKKLIPQNVKRNIPEIDFVKEE